MREEECHDGLQRNHPTRRVEDLAACPRAPQVPGQERLKTRGHTRRVTGEEAARQVGDLRGLTAPQFLVGADEDIEIDLVRARSFLVPGHQGKHGHVVLTVPGDVHREGLVDGRSRQGASVWVIGEERQLRRMQASRSMFRQAGHRPANRLQPCVGLTQDEPPDRLVVRVTGMLDTCTEFGLQQPGILMISQCPHNTLARSATPSGI